VCVCVCVRVKWHVFQNAEAARGPPVGVFVYE